MIRRSSRSRPTVKTISAEAGVSASTVSRALNDDPRISAERRIEIAAIAKRVGYTPHVNARSLVVRRTGLVGLVTGDSSNPFYPELFEALVDVAALRGLRIMPLHMSRTPLDEEALRPLLQYQMDACIMTSVEISSAAAEICNRHGLPVVMVNRVPRLHGSAVSCNNLKAGEALAELLVRNGHRKIALVAGTPTASTSRDREIGARRALSQAGLDLHARCEGGSNYAGGHAAGLAFWAAAEQPDAVICLNDIMAFGLMDALRLQGASIPKDVSVVGIDDVMAASWASYDLTTVAQPIKAMADRALDMLVQRINQPDLPSEVAYIEGVLRLRTSARIRAG